MTAWQYFQSRGDDIFAFLTLVGVSAQTQLDLPPPAMKWVIFGTSVATIAHKVFFPDPLTPASPAGASK